MSCIVMRRRNFSTSHRKAMAPFLMPPTSVQPSNYVTAIMKTVTTKECQSYTLTWSCCGEAGPSSCHGGGMECNAHFANSFSVFSYVQACHGIDSGTFNTWIFGTHFTTLNMLGIWGVNSFRLASCWHQNTLASVHCCILLGTFFVLFTTEAWSSQANQNQKEKR